MESRLKFEIGSVFNGEGFQKANAALDRTSKAVGKASGTIGALGGELGQLGGAVGKTAGAVGNLASSFAMGGPWGLAIAAVTTIVGLFIKWQQSIKETREKHAQLMRDMQQGYQRRLQIYADKARKAEEAALDAIISKGQDAINRIRALAGAYEQLGRSEDAAAASADRVKAAAIDADYAGGDAVDQAHAAQLKQEVRNATAERAADREVYNAGEAVKALQKQIAEQTQVIAAQKKRGLDATKAQDELTQMTIALSAAQNNLKAAEQNRAATIIEGETALEGLRRREAEAAEQLIQAEEREAKARGDVIRRLQAEQAKKDTAARVGELDQQIAALRLQARDWEEAAAKVRGKAFDPTNGEAALTNEDRKAARREAAREAANERKAERIRQNARHGWASTKENEWLWQYDTWKAQQDPNNNLAAKKAEQLEQEKRQAQQKLQRTLDAIHNDLNNANRVA